MPIIYLSKLTAPERSARAHFHLGIALTFVAGALNAGGFLVIGQYTSHMTGIVSAAADNLVLGHIALALAGLLSCASFIAGAGSTALSINYARRTARKNPYSAPLLAEAFLLLIFGLVGASLQPQGLISVSLTAILLCYLMGLQNALITKISNSEIRTTHVTGLVTDLGIELGKLLYWNRYGRQKNDSPVRANRKKLLIYASLALSFFVGGVVGAFGFKWVGFSSTIPLAVILIAMSLAPLFKRTA